MTSFVFIPPPSPPPVPVNPWPGIEMGWEGWDGTSWGLCGEQGISLQAGVRGMDMPPIERWSSTVPSIDGSRYLGHRTNEREVFWPTKVYQPEGSEAWLELDAAFWRTLNPGRTGTWWVRTPGPDGGTRRLTLRATGTGNKGRDIAPGLLDFELYEIYLVAEQPMWRGSLVTRPFAPEVSSPFFPGPPFRISSATTLAKSRISNPGDVEAWPDWWLVGPIAAGSEVGAAGRVIDVPFEIPAGKMLVVETAPTAQTATLIDTPVLVDDVDDQRDAVTAALAAGQDRTVQLGAATRFSPVPSGQDVPLTVSFSGESFIRVLLEPLYYRAT